MDQELFNLLFIILQVVISIGAGTFALYQYRINRRIQKRDEYVVVGISPFPLSSILFVNVGKINLYLHKWEIGSLNSAYVKPWLLAVGSRSNVSINISKKDLPKLEGQHLIKIYLEDDEAKRYITTGEIAVQSIDSQQPQPVHEQVVAERPDDVEQVVTSAENKNYSIRAWAYKTERRDWVI